MPDNMSPEMKIGGFEPATVEEIQRFFREPFNDGKNYGHATSTSIPTVEQVQKAIDKIFDPMRTVDYTDRDELVRQVVDTVSHELNRSDDDSQGGNTPKQQVTF